MAISVPDTAFVIACYRANHEEESCDPFARLWVKPGLQGWVDDFAKKVSEFDEILHCMRNRYFHQKLRSLAEEDQKLLCLNLGAGFSMYPYSLPESVVSIEADFEDVVEYKRDAVTKFEKEGLLPDRSVRFVSADITNINDQNILREVLEKYKGYRKVIMIEGVFFFLNKTQIQNVINFCADILKTNDVLLTVSFDSRTASTPVFDRLKDYFKNELQSAGNNTTIPHDFYHHLTGFSLEGIDSTLELAKELNLVPADLPEANTLNEYCYHLIRK